jgi:hypothetical protein
MRVWGRKRIAPRVALPQDRLNPAWPSIFNCREIGDAGAVIGVDGSLERSNNDAI